MSKANRTPVTLLELLEEKVDVRKLLNSVPLEEEKIIDAALEQPKLTLTAGRLRIQQFHKRTLLETRLKATIADVGLRFRRIRDDKGRKEFTNPAVTERVELSPKVRKLRNRLDKALAEEEMGKLLQEVFRQRSDSLRVIVNAGKVSVHAKELELLRTNKRLGKAVERIRRKWSTNEEGEE